MRMPMDDLRPEDLAQTMECNGAAHKNKSRLIVLHLSKSILSTANQITPFMLSFFQPMEPRPGMIWKRIYRAE